MEWNLDNMNVSCIKCIGYYHNSSRGCHRHMPTVSPFLHQSNLLVVLFILGIALIS